MGARTRTRHSRRFAGWAPTPAGRNCPNLRVLHLLRNNKTILVQSIVSLFKVSGAASKTALLPDCSLDPLRLRPPTSQPVPTSSGPAILKPQESTAAAGAQQMTPVVGGVQGRRRCQVHVPPPKIVPSGSGATPCEPGTQDTGMLHYQYGRNQYQLRGCKNGIFPTAKKGLFHVKQTLL